MDAIALKGVYLCPVIRRHTPIGQFNFLLTRKINSSGELVTTVLGANSAKQRCSEGVMLIDLPAYSYTQPVFKEVVLIEHAPSITFLTRDDCNYPFSSLRVSLIKALRGVLSSQQPKGHSPWIAFDLFIETNGPAHKLWKRQ